MGPPEHTLTRRATSPGALGQAICKAGARSNQSRASRAGGVHVGTFRKMEAGKGSLDTRGSDHPVQRGAGG